MALLLFIREFYVFSLSPQKAIWLTEPVFVIVNKAFDRIKPDPKQQKIEMKNKE